jgi:hypothetical protein
VNEGENAVLYPIFLDLSGRRCVVVGGGEVANRKARKLLQTRAEVVVISPEIKPELESVATEVLRRSYEIGDLEGAYLVFAATDAREVNAAVAEEGAGYPGKRRRQTFEGGLRVALDAAARQAAGRRLYRRGLPHARAEDQGRVGRRFQA